MKFAFFLLSLYALLGTHQARNIHGDVIQMVTEALDFQSLDLTTYGRVPRRPPSPSVAPSRGQETFGRDKPKAPPTPSKAPPRGEGSYGQIKPEAPPTPSKAPPRGEGTYGRVRPKTPPSPSVAPSRGQETFGRDKPKGPPTPSVAPARGEGTFGRVKPKTPPTPSVAPSRGQATYGGNNPDPKSRTTYDKDTNEPTGNVIEMITGEQEFQSLDQTIYGRARKTPPSPSVAPSRGQETFGRDKPKAPPTPSGAPSREQGTYGRVRPKTPPTPSVAPARGEGTYGRVKPKSPPTPSGAPSRGQGIFGQDNPSELTDLLAATVSLKQDRFRDDEATYGRDNCITSLSNELTRVAPDAPTPPKPADPIIEHTKRYADY